jgi:hypothetical protein
MLASRNEIQKQTEGTYLDVNRSRRVPYFLEWLSFSKFFFFWTVSASKLTTKKLAIIYSHLCTFPKISQSSWIVICVLLCSAWVWISLEGPPKPLTFSVQAVNFLVLFCEHHDVGVWFSSLRTFATSSTIKFFFYISQLWRLLLDIRDHSSITSSWF